MAKSPGGPRSPKKNNRSFGNSYSSTNYRISEKQERFLRFAQLFLESKKEPIHTPQQMVEDATNKYIEYLRKKYGIVFPDFLQDEDSASDSTEPKA